jgi:hypothetical protein
MDPGSAAKFSWLLQDSIDARFALSGLKVLHQHPDLPKDPSSPVPEPLQPQVRLNLTDSALLAVADAGVSVEATVASVKSALGNIHADPLVRVQLLLCGLAPGREFEGRGRSSKMLDGSSLAVAAAVPPGYQSVAVTTTVLASDTPSTIIAPASPLQVGAMAIVTVDLPVPLRAFRRIIGAAALALPPSQ